MRTFLATFCAVLMMIPPAYAGGGYRFRYQAQEAAQERSLRASDAYKRAHLICTQPYYGTARFIYLKESVVHIHDLVTSLEAWEDLAVAEYYLSPLLAHDLQHDGFRLALKDCGLSVEFQNQLVLSLILLDVSGKLLAAATIAAVLKYSYKLSKFLFKNLWLKNRALAWSVFTVSNLVFLFNLYRQTTSKKPNANADNVVLVDNANVSEVFNTAQIASENAELKELMFQVLNEELATANPEERAEIEKKIRVLNSL